MTVKTFLNKYLIGQSDVLDFWVCDPANNFYVKIPSSIVYHPCDHEFSCYDYLNRKVVSFALFERAFKIFI